MEHRSAHEKIGMVVTEGGHEGVTVARLRPLGEAPGAEQTSAWSEIAHAIIELGQRCLWKPMAGGLVFPPRMDSLARASVTPDKVEVLYALVGGKIAGFLVLHLGDAINQEYAAETVRCMERLGSQKPAFVRSLGVGPEVRGRGVGQRLLRAALTRAAHHGAPVLAGHVKCRPDSDQRLTTAFERAGFIQDPGRVSVTVVKDKLDGTFRELESSPYGGEQVPLIYDIEYSVWVAPTDGHEFRSSCGVTTVMAVSATNPPLSDSSEVQDASDVVVS